MTTLDLGVGARQVLECPASGRVVAVYRAAAYLRFPAGLLALTTGRAPRGPLHLRVATLPPTRPGDVVRTDGAVLGTARWAIELAVPNWTGTLPPAALLATRHRTRGPVAEMRRAEDLAGIAAMLGGRGPGLTPAGDDVLAGVLLVARTLGGAAREPELSEVSRSVRTTDIAAAFLAWAARGQCIEPAHRWLHAMARGEGGAVARARAQLVSIGASSGHALVAGMRLGLSLPASQIPDSEIHTTRATCWPGLDQRCARSVG